MTQVARQMSLVLWLWAGICVTLSSAADSIDAVAAVAAKNPECRDLAQELQKQVLALSHNGQQFSNRSRQGQNTDKDVREAQVIIDRLQRVTQQEAKTPAGREALAQDLFQAAADANRMKLALNRDLGVPPSGVMERVIINQAEVLARASAAIPQLDKLGKGAPLSSPGWDGSQPRTQNQDILRVGGPQPFGPPRPVVTVTEYVPITVEQVKQVNDTYGSLPQGVALEGTAILYLGDKPAVHYDRRFNALVFDDRAVYFLKVAPWNVAVLLKAIDADTKERAGVSIGRTLVSYGAVPNTSDVAATLFLVDKFLAEIVFGQRDWSRHYLFKDGFSPETRNTGDGNVAVGFYFNNFQFDTRQGVLQLTGAGFDVKLYPVSSTPALDGGGQPDYEAMHAGRSFPEYERNARHLLSQIEYYKQEPIVQRAFDYGELTALVRALKAANVNLQALAREVLAN
jgi:hypothetical protein